MDAELSKNYTHGLAKNHLQLPSLIQSTKDGAMGEVKGSCLAEERGNKMG